MSPRTEDLVGKLLLLGAFGWLLIEKVRQVSLMFAAGGAAPLVVATQLLSLGFVALVVVMTLRRLPARTSASGWVPRIDAILGTFLLILLAWAPPGRAPESVLLLATLLIVGGTAASIWCLHFLGRSFAVLAAARALVTQGPYGIVRHPLYLAEGVTTIGIILAHWSVPALALGLAQFAFQFRRMQHEEAILRAAFPEYTDYAQRVPMIVPALAR